MLQGRKVLLGVTGSIAAYKSLLLVRLLVKAGAEVKVIMTPAAKDFVTPLSLSTLSKHAVLTDLFAADTWANHVELGRWADVMVIAPLSCNTLAKMAHGLCDNLLLATYLSAVCPVVVAPAMDEDMWHHPSTMANLDRVRSFGNRVIPVGKGELASGLYGDGRMAEPEQILDFVSRMLGEGLPLTGRRALVTAGPTHEAIDPVRFIGNHSSGKMGIAIARELARRGAQVDLVLGPVSSETGGLSGVTVHKVVSANEMYEVCVGLWPSMQIGVMSAAVADYMPAVVASEKIKKKDVEFSLELVRTKDILRALGERKQVGQVLVGFALETTGEREYALGKLTSKHADMIVLNSLNDAGAGFGHDTNKVTVFQKDGQETAFGVKPKQQVASDIVDILVKLPYA